MFIRSSDAKRPRRKIFSDALRNKKTISVISGFDDHFKITFPFAMIRLLHFTNYLKSKCK
jgi:hypothetical protein